MELLKEAVPGVSRVAVLRNPASPGREGLWGETVVAAQAIGLRIQALDITEAGQLNDLFDAAVRQRAGGLIVIRDPLTNTLRARIVELAAQHKIPAMYASREYVDAGGLMAYGSNVLYLYRRSALYLDKILTLPWSARSALTRDQPEDAKALGLTIPQSVLARADEVIQ